MLAAIVSKKYT